jgi:hypothetical protein
MSIRVYSGYDEFKFDEEEICEYLESDFSDTNVDEESDDVFFYTESKIDFRDDADFYIICDTEDEEIAEDIASYLGKVKKINLEDFRKSFFYIR